jgi:uncharacterized cupredoxin-like copper-binding protein
MRRSGRGSIAVGLMAATLVMGIFAAAGGASPGGVTATKVTVAASEFKFVLSKRTVPAGIVTFVVTNKGKTTHDFKIAGKKTPVLKPGKSTTLRVTLKKGRYPYLCTLPGHAAAGMKGRLSAT